MSQVIPPAVDTSIVPTTELPWAELLPGMEVQLLRTGGGTGRYTVLVRFQPGVQIPRHRHHGEVHAWTVRGHWHYLEYPWVAGPGDYIHEADGSVHTLAVPATNSEPTVVLFVIDGPQDYLDDDGATFFVQDAEAVRSLYEQHLRERGLPFPAAVLA